MDTETMITEPNNRIKNLTDENNFLKDMIKSYREEV